MLISNFGNIDRIFASLDAQSVSNSPATGRSFTEHSMKSLPPAKSSTYRASSAMSATNTASAESRTCADRNQKTPPSFIKDKYLVTLARLDRPKHLPGLRHKTSSLGSLHKILVTELGYHLQRGAPRKPDAALCVQTFEQVADLVNKSTRFALRAKLSY